MAVQFQGDDGPALDRLHELQRQRAAGAISQRQFNARYAALNRRVGVRCSRCGTPPAQIRTPDGRALCGPCAAGRGRVPWRRLALWAVVVVVPLLLALAYAAALH